MAATQPAPPQPSGQHLARTFQHAVAPRTRYDRFKALADPIALPVINAVYRMQLRVRKLHGGNAAVCQVLLPDRSMSIRAFSRKSQRPFNPRNAAFIGLTNLKPHDWRWVDTEYQILNFLHATGRFSPAASFTVRLYTERAPCLSCSAVIGQFLRYYRNARIEIYFSRPDDVAARPSWRSARIRPRLSLNRTI